MKNAYSCKNVVQRGKKRKLLKKYFDKSGKKPQVAEPVASSEAQASNFMAKVKKVRIVFYENVQVEQPV